MTSMAEDFPCCYNLNGEESSFGDDAVDTDVCGRYPSDQLPNPERAEDKLQTLSLYIWCKMEQVQILTVPCKHLTMCESCACDRLVWLNDDILQINEWMIVGRDDRVAESDELKEVTERLAVVHVQEIKS